MAYVTTKQFNGLGQAEWMQKLQSGQLQPASTSFAPGCSNPPIQGNPAVCAFDPSNPGVVYLTQLVPNWQAPPNYQVGPAPSSWSYTGSGTPPWPGSGPDPRIAPPTPMPSLPYNTSVVTPQSLITQGIQTYAPTPMTQLTTPPPAQSSSSGLLLIAGGLVGLVMVALLLIKRKKHKAAVTAEVKPSQRKSKRRKK